MTITLPSLNYTAKPGITPAGFTYSRGSNGTYVNAIGNIAYASSSVLRHDYDPVLGTYWGWLIEGAATNLLLQSQFATGWVSQASTLTTNNAVAPDGTTTALLITENTTNNPHGTFPSSPLTTVSGTTYSASVWLKMGTCRYVAISIQSNGSAQSFLLVFLIYRVVWSAKQKQAQPQAPSCQRA